MKITPYDEEENAKLREENLRLRIALFAIEIEAKSKLRGCPFCGIDWMSYGHLAACRIGPVYKAACLLYAQGKAGAP